MTESIHVSVPQELVEAIARRVAELLAEEHCQEAAGFLNVEQAAEYLAAPRSRVYELVERGRVQVHRDGRRLLFRRADLDAGIKAPVRVQ